MKRRFQRRGANDRQHHEIATIEYPAAKRLDLPTLWDLHWSKAWMTRVLIDDLAKRTEG